MELNEREIFLLGKNPKVTKQEFLDNFWSLNPTGNVEDAYLSTAYVVAREKTFEGNPVTLELLVKKYTEYLRQEKLRGTEPQWIRGINKFLTNRDWNLQFGGISDSKLDQY
jgi:hypothetical protein